MTTFIFRFIKYLLKWLFLFTIIPFSIYMIFFILLIYHGFQGMKAGIRTIY